jgi:hypothetical protein
MKVLGTIGAVLLCLIVRSEILSMIGILVAAVAFFSLIGKENVHDSW